MKLELTQKPRCGCCVCVMGWWPLLERCLSHQAIVLPGHFNLHSQLLSLSLPSSPLPSWASCHSSLRWLCIHPSQGALPIWVHNCCLARSTVQGQQNWQRGIRKVRTSVSEMVLFQYHILEESRSDSCERTRYRSHALQNEAWTAMVLGFYSEHSGKSWVSKRVVSKQEGFRQCPSTSVASLLPQRKIWEPLYDLGDPRNEYMMLPCIFLFPYSSPLSLSKISFYGLPSSKQYLHEFNTPFYCYHLLRGFTNLLYQVKP